MVETQQIESIKIGLASPQQILSWSSGEVKKPETINYRTFKPERDGLFCERIFGPTKDWECHCGRYKKIKYKGIICDKCGVQVTRAAVRRRTMGHISLAAPVAHIWFLKALPSPIGLLLDMPPRDLEEVAYFASYIVTECDRKTILANMDSFEDTIEEQVAAVKAEGERRKNDNLRSYMQRLAEAPTDEEKPSLRRDMEEKNRDEDHATESRLKEIQAALPLLRDLREKTLIKEMEYRDLMQLLDAASQKTEQNLKKCVHAASGAQALKDLLQRIDLEELARELKLDVSESESTSAKRQRAIRRLSVVNWFRKSKNRPEWMIVDVLPVLPPDLRPMVQLDGGRFAASDVNDLYRRVINRNNRLKRIMEIRAPESIVNHERRLLQEAVDALIDNSRRRRPVTGPNRRELKSLTDMLKGKEGRFRKNLLGKRVDYSGRSVIVIGPDLQLDECGLPREMALELFKPMVIRRLYEQDASRSIKKTKRMVERLDPEVWDALEEVVKDHPVLLNRAPTLHRLGVQAFIPRLVDGKAIQIHPLICDAFNADFDGDTMAVHVPLSTFAQAEAFMLMLSSRNLFKPANGIPIVSPLYDIVLGCAYMTQQGELARNLPPRAFANASEAILAYNTGQLDLHAPLRTRLHKVEAEWQGNVQDGVPLAPSAKAKIENAVHYISEASASLLPSEIRIPLDEPQDAEIFRSHSGLPSVEHLLSLVRELREASQVPSSGNLVISVERKLVDTTVGRLIFNELLIPCLRNYEHEIGKKELSELALKIYGLFGPDSTVEFLERVKTLGFYFATVSGLSISLRDMDIVTGREEIIQVTQSEVDRVDEDFRNGLMTQGEREDKIVNLWQDAHDKVGDAIMANISRFNPLYLMVNSGARGSMRQIGQLSGMRGLMSDPFGRLIEDLPVKSNFHEGLKVLEYFVSTHGARKGLADTALRTADAGYLTRKLVDVAQEVVIAQAECGTTEGLLVKPLFEQDVFCRVCGKEDLHRNRDAGGALRCSACGEALPEATDELIENLTTRIVGRTCAETVPDPESGEVIVERNQLISQKMADRIEAAGIRQVRIRSPLTCRTKRGICAACYGLDLASHRPVEVGEAIGVIAAQSIGEPGTQLTLRTFHIGGVAAQYLTGVADIRKRRQENLRQLHSDIERGFVGGLASATARERAKAIQDVLKLLEDTVSGILRVGELLEARKPKGQAIITDVNGIVDRVETEPMRRVIVAHEHQVRPPKSETTSAEAGTPLHCGCSEQIKGEIAATPIVNPKVKKVVFEGGSIDPDKLPARLRKEGLHYLVIEKSFLVPYRGYLQVGSGQKVGAGDRLTQGPLDPADILKNKGARAAQEYLVKEIQAAYTSHGVEINDKHTEVIIRQMFRKRRIVDCGGTEFLPGENVDFAQFEDENARVRQLGAGEATAVPVLQGVTESSLATESFLSAASFQKTTKVLTEAALQGKVDPLYGLKENVIIGRLIPAGTGFARHNETEIHAEDESLEDFATASLHEAHGSRSELALASDDV